MYASTSARRASASIRRAPSRTSSSITDDAADRAAPEPSRSAESETTVSIGSYLPDQRLPRRSSLEPSICHPGRYAPSQADPQISSIAHELAPGVLPELGDRRVLGAPYLGELGEAFFGRGFGCRGVDRADVLGDLIPVPARRVAKGVAQQVDHACLHDRAGPHGVDRLRQPFEAVADHDAHIGSTAVLDLGEHREPELRPLSAVAGPQPEDVALPSAGHPDGHIDGPVGDLAVADLDEDRIDEHHRIHRAVSNGRCESWMDGIAMPRYAPNKMPAGVKRRYFELIRAGIVGSVAAQAVGVSLSCGSLWFIDAGSVRFVDTPISPRYLTQDDRIEISDGLHRRERVKDIAERIGKTYQSVYREIARNRKPD